MFNSFLKRRQTKRQYKIMIVYVHTCNTFVFINTRVEATSKKCRTRLETLNAAYACAQNHIPDSSRSLRMLCSGALIDGSIILFVRGRDFVLGVSGSGGPPVSSCVTAKSALLCTPADTRSFHILPSFYLTK